MLPGHVVHSKGRHISAKTTAFANVFVVGLVQCLANTGQPAS